MKMVHLNNRGFTLVELLVSMSIIGILTAILLPNFMGTRDRADDSKKKQEMIAMKTALRLYYNDNQTYPVSVGGSGWTSDIGSTILAYMPSVVNLGYTYEYKQINGGDGFLLRTMMEATTEKELLESQGRCGVIPTDLYYYVCGN